MKAKLRIVSLIASATEIVCALGCEEQLVGRSHECDYPATVKQLPQCTKPKFATDGSSYQIDQRVKAILQEGLSVYHVDADTLKRLKPDIIITQIQCEVCAVSEQDVAAAVASMIASQPKIVALNPNSLHDIWNDFQKVADALDVPDKGHELIHSCQQRMAAIAAEAKALEPPRVACIEWIEPLMSGGNWLPELVKQAGGINLFGEAGKHSPLMTWGELLTADPDVIVVLPCGWDTKKARHEMPLLTTRPLWSDLKAVRTQRVYLADGNQYFNRPGPRLVESMECLAEMFHPETFDFGHKGIGWESLYPSDSPPSTK